MATNAERQAAWRERRDAELRALRGERDRPSSFVRACSALLTGEVRGVHPDRVVREFWPRDEATALVLRSAVNPASLTASHWASDLVQTSAPAFVESLAPASAAAALFSDPDAMSLSFNGSGAILVPAFAAAAANASFVGEGLPIPVRQLVASSVTLSPRKLAVISVFSKDIFEYSTPSIEELVGRTLAESVGAALSAAVFDATAGDTARPAGLLASIAATGASALTPATEAMHADLSNLAAAVAPVSGTVPPVFVCSPKQATSIKTRVPNIGYQILSSASLASGVVICIAPPAIVSVMGPPRIETARDATLHMDTAPGPLTTVGTPNTWVAPIRSNFQTASVGIRVILEIAWALRSPTGLAWTQSVVW